MDDSRYMTDADVLTALKRQASRVEQAGPGRWRLWLSLRNGASYRGTARVESGWLTVDFAPAGRLPADPWATLLVNAEAPAGVKLTMDEGCGTSHLSGELSLALDEACELDRRVGELLSGVEDLSTASKGGKRSAAHEGGASSAVASVPPAPAAAELLQEAGWPFTDRSEGCVAVTLEVQRQPFQAVVKPRSNGGLVASVTLAGGREPPRVSHRRALALLLLSASRSVRLARAAAVEEADGRFEARLEAALRPGAGAGDLTDALSALSVACRWCGPEAELVHESSLVAETYLLGCSRGSSGGSS